MKSFSAFSGPAQAGLLSCRGKFSQSDQTFVGCGAVCPPAIIPRLGRGAISQASPSSTTPVRSLNVLNSVAASRRLAQRAIAWQAGATVLVALAFLVQGQASALAALVGGGALALGTWLSTWIALGGGVSSAGVALSRLVAGMVAKWLLVLVVFTIALGLLRLPGLPLLVGLCAAMLALVLANTIKR
ncbi:ATP synthase I [Pseudoxanthomonas composti]|uniref:ATP synthase I n=1 Tax=Pseudoxanthomonas composti TaxID=2137479 RepID=A0A4Q1JSD1_9GAMM|nr:ATP synthase I [Pseudoxanthomonas composti]